MSRPTDVEGVLLTHGAGSDRNQSTLLAIEERLSPLPVDRMNFPYRNKPGKRPPDRAPVLLAALATELEAVCARIGTTPGRIVLGGRSMGGRICSMLVAEGTACAGLVLISYPLHPPGKPDKLRTEHLPRVGGPCLFISGDRDPFGTPAELEAATALLVGDVSHHWIAGGRHDLKGHDDEVADVIAAWLTR